MLDNIPGDRDCAVRNTCIRLFRQYSGDELQRKIAEHTADDWADSYKHKVFVGVEPPESVSYRHMNQEKRDSYDKAHKDWHQSGRMLEWVRGEAKTVAENESNQSFLEDMLTYIQNDPVRKSKLEQVLSSHTGVKVGVPSVDWNS